jgi:tetratricopeptide (TPR) repeat protein
MRRTVVAAVLIAASATGPTAQSTSPRIDILERWFAAVAQHEPGTSDAGAATAGSWSIPQLRTLWVDLTSLVTAIRRPETAIFRITPQGRRLPETIRYTSFERARLRLLSRVASGTLRRDDRPSAELRALAARVSAANLRGDGNYVLKRGALLHADLAMSASFVVEPLNSGDRIPAPRVISFLLHDGHSVDVGYGAVHWEIARFLLDQVMPSPRADPMVRDFYRATVAYQQRDEKYQVPHLEHGRELFPDDALLLFFSGSQHEAFASPQVQSIVRTVRLPYGISLGVDPPALELRRAERFFRRALQLDPSFDEARIRHGRVLGLLERHSEAETDLQQAVQSATDPVLRYYAELFIGAEREALGQFEAARASYGHAAAMNEAAQAPHVALGHLARRVGDRAAALRALHQAFAVARRSDGPQDPWWTYASAAGRNAGDLLARLWHPFHSVPSEQQ